MCCVACPRRETTDCCTAVMPTGGAVMHTGGAGSHPVERQELLFPAVGNTKIQ